MAARTTDTHPTIAWTAVLFAVGSSYFLLAALTSLWSSTPRDAIGVTFFAGSVCFTSAAYLQHWLAVRSAPPWRRDSSWSPRHPARWPARHVDVLASLIQLAGTVLFNVNTFEAMKAGALGFLIGALLLYPRGDADAAAQANARDRRQRSG